MSAPIIILSGHAGSGKDTIANFMVKNHGGVAIALADPIKRFARLVFGFTNDQLWGPSELRGIPDPISRTSEFWMEVSRYFDNDDGKSSRSYQWLREIGFLNADYTFRRLQDWFEEHICTQEELTPRHVLQTLGTEFGRAIYPRVWINYCLNTVDKLLIDGGDYIPYEGYIKISQTPKFVVITDGRMPNEIAAVRLRGGKALRIYSNDSVINMDHSSEKDQSLIPEEWFDGMFENNKNMGLWTCEQQTRKIVEQMLFQKRFKYNQSLSIR